MTPQGYSVYVAKHGGLPELKWAYAWEIANFISKHSQPDLPWIEAVDDLFCKALTSIREEQVMFTWAEKLSTLDLHPTQFPELMSTFYRWMFVITDAWQYEVKELTKYLGAFH